MPTFVFELDYFSEKDKIRKEGWLLVKKGSATEFYMISWLWASNFPNNKERNKKELDIRDIKYKYLTKSRFSLIKKHIYMIIYKIKNLIKTILLKSQIK